MEILQFLLSFFMEEYGGSNLKPLFDIFKENNFDLKKALSSISPEKIAPIVKNIFMPKENINNEQTTSNKLSPISSFADKEIINCLNNYFN